LGDQKPNPKAPFRKMSIKDAFLSLNAFPKAAPLETIREAG
jgi:hypothetical protein